MAAALAMGAGSDVQNVLSTQYKHPDPLLPQQTLPTLDQYEEPEKSISDRCNRAVVFFTLACCQLLHHASLREFKSEEQTD
jgi:hypothetical protein